MTVPGYAPALPTRPFSAPICEGIAMIDRVKSLASLMRMKKEQGQPSFVLMLGAGASISSGVPSASTIMKELVSKYDDSAMNGAGVEQRFDRLWTRSPDHIRAGFLEPYLKKREPSIGYRKLAELIKAEYFDVILTFNFDDLIETALDDASVKGVKRVLRNETRDEEMEKLVESKESRVKLVKLHGSLQSTGYFLFDSREMLRYPDSIAAMLKHATARDIVVCGYSFNDNCVVQAFADRGGLVVCVNPGGVPRPLAALLKDRYSEDREIVTPFDEFFVALHRELMVVEPPGPKPKLPPNPFKFLESYDVGDAASFTGRDFEIGTFFRYIDRAHAPRVIVIAGPGRAGKTSLVRAGLLARLKPELHRGLYLRSQQDIRRSVPADLAARGEVPASLELPDALAALTAAHPERRTVLFLDQFERVANCLERTTEGMQKLGESLAPLLTSEAAENLTIVLVVTDDGSLGASLAEECSRLDVPNAVLVCRAFSQDDVIRIMQSLADNAGFEFDTRIIQDLAQSFVDPRNLALPERRFTLAHVHAICHLLARTQRVSFSTYKLMFDQANLDVLHDAINVREFASFVEDRTYPSSAWLRAMLKVPLQESKERIAEYIKTHYEDIVPPDTRSTGGGGA